MRILQLCKKNPMPAKDGEGVAVMSLARAYKLQGAELHLLSFNTSKHYTDEQDLELLDHPYSVYNLVYLDNRINKLDAVINLFSKKSFHIERFESEKFASTLKKMLEQFNYEVIQLESLFMAPYIEIIRNYSDAKVIMRSHNIESVIWKDLAEQESSFLKKRYLNLCAQRLSAYETNMIFEYDGLLPISSTDARYYKSLNAEVPMCTIPVGITVEEVQSRHEKAKKMKFGYIGSLDWMPNVEGLKWLFGVVWPQFFESSQNKFYLAGRNAVKEIIDLNQNQEINYLGEVDSSRDFLSSLDVVVVPLFSGSGIRVKILEAMALGKAVISTPKGYEGIEITHGKNALVFNSEVELLDILYKLTGNIINASAIGEEASCYIKENFDQDKLASKAIEFIKSI